MPLLFGLLQSDDESLQSAAAEVLTEIVSKRMDAEAKLRLVQQLGLTPVAGAWKGGLPGHVEGELPLKCSRLLAALCNGRISLASRTAKIRNCVNPKSLKP